MNQNSERQVFDVDNDILSSFSRIAFGKEQSNVSNLVNTSNTSVLLKFCDVCKNLNLDPMDPNALHIVIIFMSKSKRRQNIARMFTTMNECKEVIENMNMDEESFQGNTTYFEMLNSMADWITLFSYFKLKLNNKKDRKIHLLHNEIEKNTVIQRMVVSLTEAQVHAAGNLPEQKITPVETAVLAILYLSPISTPAGKMLESLYISINDKPRDAELRCLRAMTYFKDTSDDEDAYSDALQLVLRSFETSVDFIRSISAVLKKRILNSQENVSGIHQNIHARPLLRNYVHNALANKQKCISQDSWIKWQLGVNFQKATGLHLQRLLYFISTQSISPNRELYECYYTIDICNRCKELTVDVIDVDAIMMVVNSLRLYKNNLKTLIDFSGLCLRGVNQKTRQGISLVQTLQLYIAIFQHESIWKDCWKKILPMMNHTIMTDVKRFRDTHVYDIDAVVYNLVHSLVDDK